MRFRAGLVVGFAAGFYLGSWAGRERYEQINQTLGKVKESDAFDTATGKAKAAVDRGRLRAKDIVDARRRRDATSADDLTQPGIDASPLEHTPHGDGSG